MKSTYAIHAKIEVEAASEEEARKLVRSILQKIDWDEATNGAFVNFVVTRTRESHVMMRITKKSK